MKNLTIPRAGFLLAAAFLVPPRSIQSQAPDPPSSDRSVDLTVMTWNLEWFYDDESGDNHSKLAREKSAPSRADWDWRRDAVASSIAKANPTIFAVQEVESRRVLWYLTRALARNHKQEYHELCIEGRDHFTEQDVGFLFRPPVDVVSATQLGYPKRLRSSNQYQDVSKHIMAVFDFPVADGLFERLFVINVHLRAMADAEPLRIRQARLLNHWITHATDQGANIILLGDFNTEERGRTTRPKSDMWIAAGRETPETEDDLVDLNLRLPESDRQTHLLSGRQFDRILCSRSLIEDDPQKPDLVFSGIQIRRELAIRGKPDTPEEHWEAYWKLSPEDRDLSDHYPVIATFQVR